MSTPDGSDTLFADIEDQLRPLADTLERPRPGDWLAEHHERGQTYHQYRAAKPVRRNSDCHTIYLCRLGPFDPAQEAVLDLMSEYLRLFFDTPVVTRRSVTTSELPNHAKRKHPVWGDRQLLAPYILDSVLLPDRPDDALAYLAVTARDLWPGGDWNYVFGQANLRDRIAVFSTYRSGHPAKGVEAFRLCVRRTLMTAAHEVGHTLTLQHCTAYRCLMNGWNHQAERDSRPLNPCPVCLRKMVWNLQIRPSEYLAQLAVFCREHQLEEADWYQRAAELLRS